MKFSQKEENFRILFSAPLISRGVLFEFLSKRKYQVYIHWANFTIFVGLVSGVLLEQDLSHRPYFVHV